MTMGRRRRMAHRMRSSSRGGRRGRPRRRAGGRCLPSKQERCRILCAPALKIEPTFTVENLFRAPLVETIEDGVVVESGREKRETVFELIFALDVPTAIPRLGLTLEAIFKPFGATDVNPFTGASAARHRAERHSRQRRRNRGRAEHPSARPASRPAAGCRLMSTSWTSSVRPISPSAGSVFTHKLDFEWDTAFHLFNRLPEGHWLRNVEAEVSLDYLATGLPKAGDVLGSERFVAAREPVVAVVRAGDAAGAARAMMSRRTAPAHAEYGPKT